jgi:hypothetical protein
MEDNQVQSDILSMEDIQWNIQWNIFNRVEVQDPWAATLAANLYFLN